MVPLVMKAAGHDVNLTNSGSDFHVGDDSGKAHRVGAVCGASREQFKRGVCRICISERLQEKQLGRWRQGHRPTQRSQIR